MMTETAIAFCVLLLVTVTVSWTPSSQPKYQVKYNEKQATFFGNVTDYFRVLDQDDNSMLIGARNFLYNISFNGLIENKRQRIEWRSSDAHRELCTLKGKTETDCQNYIRVFARISEQQIMVCGTNSYKPYCRYYNVQPEADTLYELSKETEAMGRCPYNPTHNSTYVYTDGQLYSATVADFSGADPLIIRENVRTEQYDLKQLNQPAFVNAVDYNGYVFFFFREIAMEYMNCGKSIYSRVGRVCKNDKGGPYPFAERWTSFLKTRLNCSMPGEYPFYFDEIQATSKIIEGIYNQQKNDIIYIVLTTPVNAIGGSAVCAFTMSDIVEAFGGRFKSQETANSNWLPVPEEKVPAVRPGQCVDDSRTLPSSTVNFQRTHTLMDDSVPSLYGEPVFVKVSLQYRLTSITVDPQVEALNGKKYDVVFVGTDDGRVIKFINTRGPDTDAVETVVISETQALPHGVRVSDLRIAKSLNQLVVLGSGRLVSIPLHNCQQMRHCRECLELQDPYCIWHDTNHECVSVHGNQNAKEGFIQDLTGKKRQQMCKKYDESENWVEPQPTVIQKAAHGTLSAVSRSANEIPPLSVDSTELSNNIGRFHLDEPIQREIYEPAINQIQPSAASMGWWIILVAIATSAGVILGIFLTRKCSKNEPYGPNQLSHRNQLNWHGGTKSFLPPPRTGGKDVNLQMNTNAFTASLCNNKKDNLELELDSKDRNHECKNSTESLEKEIPYKTGTLQKVKKTYI